MPELILSLALLSGSLRDLLCVDERLRRRAERIREVSLKGTESGCKQLTFEVEFRGKFGDAPWGSVGAAGLDRRAFCVLFPDFSSRSPAWINRPAAPLLAGKSAGCGGSEQRTGHPFGRSETGEWCLCGAPRAS